MRTLKGQIGWCSRAQWVLGVTIVVCLGGFYLLGYRPQTRRLADLHMQIDARQRELRANQSRTLIRPEVERKVNELKRRLDRFDKRLPRQQEIAQFIREVTHLSRQSSLRRWEVMPEAPRRFPNDAFAELPIRLKFEGDFLSVFSFLRQMEDMQRLTRVRGMNVRTADPSTGQVVVDLSMNIYFSEG
jgi:Tfp pilus assembly protein PilO